MIGDSSYRECTVFGKPWIQRTKRSISGLLICRAYQWTGFYMIGTSVMKKLIYAIDIILSLFRGPNITASKHKTLLPRKLAVFLTEWTSDLRICSPKVNILFCFYSVSLSVIFCESIIKSSFLSWYKLQFACLYGENKCLQHIFKKILTSEISHQHIPQKIVQTFFIKQIMALKF